MLAASLVCYRSKRKDLERLFSSLREMSDFFLFILVSGTDEEFGEVIGAIEDAELSCQVRLTHRYDNLGFASGHNKLLRQAFEAGAEMCLVVNPDVTFTRTAIRALTDAGRTLEGEIRSVLVGPTLISGHTASVDGRFYDSAGILWTRDGRHFDACQGLSWSIIPGRIRRVMGLTGACLLVTKVAHAQLVSESGWFFDDLFLAYREDAELGVRAMVFGVDQVLLDVEGITHERSVRGAQRGARLPDLLGVRNRFLMRWRMRDHRPGSPFRILARDAVVSMATLLFERSSFPGLAEAVRIRSYARLTSPYPRDRLGGR